MDLGKLLKAFDDLPPTVDYPVESLLRKNDVLIRERQVTGSRGCRQSDRLRQVARLGYSDTVRG